MKRRWEILVVGIAIGIIVGKTYEAIAGIIVFSATTHVPPELILKSKYAKWDSLALDPDATQIPTLSTNYLISLMGVHSSQVVVRGIDLRLFNENLLGLLVEEKHLLTKEEAVDLIKHSTADAAQFRIIEQK